MDKTKNPKGAGRKPMPETIKAKNRSVKFTDAEWEEIKLKAQAEGLRMSEYIKKKLGA